jgi:hypothetical protein
VVRHPIGHSESMLLDTQESGAHLLPPIKPACLCGDAGVSARINDVRALDEPQKHDSDARTLPHCGWESRRGPKSDAYGSAARDTSPTAYSPPQPLARRPPLRGVLIADTGAKRRAGSFLRPTGSRTTCLSTAFTKSPKAAARAAVHPRTASRTGLQPNGRENPPRRHPVRQAHDRPSQRRGPKRVRHDEAFRGDHPRG